MSKQPTKAGWARETERMINLLTPDVRGKAFDPSWFALHNRLEEAEHCMEAAIELIDGCKNIVEIYPFEFPAQDEWRDRWMEKANRLTKAVTERNKKGG